MKRRISIALVLCLLLSMLPVQTLPETASAASKPSLSSSEVLFDNIGDYKNYTIKNVKKSQVKSLKVSMVDIEGYHVASKKILSKKSFRIKAKSEGSAYASIKLTLKKKIKGKKVYRFYLFVFVEPDEPTPTATASPTPTPTPTAMATPTTIPSATPTVSPSASPGATPTPTVKPTQAPSETLTEEVAYQRMIAMQSEYPQGMRYTNADKYVWYAFFYPPEYLTWNLGGCAAFAAILSDAVFGVEKKDFKNPPKYPARQIDYPDPSIIRVGDIIRFLNDSHSAMVIGRDGDEFTIAEGNFNSSINWGRKIPKSTTIDYIMTRWPE